MTQRSGSTAAGSIPGWIRRIGLVSAAAAVLASAGCGGAKDADDARVEPAGTDSVSPAASADVTAPQPAPAAVQPGSPEALHAAEADSIREARLYHERIGSMEDYAGCMGKAKAADPPQRVVLETACRRARGAPR
ncbi:MAG: hypothetical protein JWM27_4688 [Gemmatimonadetes bacterium]|nr:hypothetical protein [Gemmatimonadota bacterium]